MVHQKKKQNKKKNKKEKKKEEMERNEKEEEEKKEKDNIMEEDIKCVSELKKTNCRFCFSYFSKLNQRICPAMDKSCI